MKEWTLEERYRVLKSPEDIRSLHERIKDSVYRQKYHIQPVTGLSSDPNGFVYHKGKWHLFYQWTPWGAVHGLKYWYHVVSEDLVHWQNMGVGLSPGDWFDNKGTHSGSAISADGELYFFYTGNHRDENWVRTPYTCAARLGEDGKPIKLKEPLFGPRDDYSEHQRDPKVVFNHEKNKYYILIGAQTKDERGTVLIYESDELLSGWRFAGQLSVPGYEKFGGMWECPYIVNISGKDVLIFSPQYTKLPGRGESTNHNVYLIGKMDYDTLTFTPESDYKYLDFGFDFYAAQGAANVGDKDKAVLIAWIGLPDNHYPTEPEEWEGSMSLPRELRIKDGQLVQTPIEEIYSLREKEIPACGKLVEYGEIEATFTDTDTDLILFAKEDGSGGFSIRYDSHSRIATIDKRGMDKRFNENVGEVLPMPVAGGLHKLNIFIDRCSVEIFVNGGEAVFTAHVYPTAEEHHYTITNYNSFKMWQYKESVKDDFAV